jgi:hypothetical protein
MELGAIQSPGPSNRVFNSNHGNGNRPFNTGMNGRGDNPRFRRLTPDDRATLRKEGLCFYCKEPGHIAEYCPNKPGNEKKAGKAPAR